MYRKYRQGWMKHLDFMIIDMLCLQIAFILSYVIRHGLQNPYLDMDYRNLAIFIEVADIAIIYIFETFQDVLKRGYYQEFAVPLKHSILIMLVAVLFIFSLKESTQFSRIVIFMTTPLYAFISYVQRIIWKQILKKYSLDINNRTLLIITNNGIAEDVVTKMKKNNYAGYNINGVAIIDEKREGDVISGIPVVADYDDVLKYVCREWVDEVFVKIDIPEIQAHDFLEKLVETGVVVHLGIAQEFETIGSKQIFERMGDYAVMTTTINYITAKQAFLKRMLDIVGGLVGTFFTGVLFVFIAPAIFISSPGPIFFKQERIGKNGKRFKMYKFRSMYRDAEERKKELMEKNRIKDGMMFKLDFDERIIGNKIMPNGEKKTGIGDFIRRTSLDEFPQFINVLKGDMSLVGTRPPTVDEWEKYELHHRARLSIKPGITGMWQTSGRSNITDFEEVVRLDTEYIKNWTPGLDIRILLKTVVSIVSRKGSM